MADCVAQNVYALVLLSEILGYLTLCVTVLHLHTF